MKKVIWVKKKDVKPPERKWKKELRDRENN